MAETLEERVTRIVEDYLLFETRGRDFLRGRSRGFGGQYHALPEDYAYLVYPTSATTANVKSGVTEQISYSGTHIAAIQWALNNLTVGRTWKERVVLKGTFTLNTQLTIPSYTILDLLQAELISANGVNQALIANTNWVAGDTDIEILGGIIDGNGAGQVGVSIHTVHLHKVTRLTINDIEINDPKNWALCIDYCESIEINGFRSSSSLGTNDGIHLYDTIKANITDVIAETGDDVIAIEAATRDVYGININHVYGTSQTADVLKFYVSGEDLTIKDVNVNDLIANNPKDRGIIFEVGAAGYIYQDINIENFIIDGTQTFAGVHIASGNRLTFKGIVRSPTQEGFKAVSINNSIIEINVSNPGGGFNAISILAGAGNKIRNTPGYVIENSGTSTGTGLQQTIAHGLAGTPNRVWFSDIEALANPYQSAAADANNIYVLAVINQDYAWKAEIV